MKAARLLFIILLIGCGAPQPSTTQTASTKSITRSGVLFYGDSIFGLWDLGSYFPGQNYVNGGYFGQRTDQLLARLPDALSGKNLCSGFDGGGDPSQSTLTCRPITPPATIVIYAGWNNLFQANVASASSDIAQMVKLSNAAGVRAILCTIYPFDPAHPAPWMVPTGTAPVTFYDGWRIPINDSIKQDDPRIVDLSAVFDGKSDYTIDGVHPNAAGYVQMHDAIAAALAVPPHRIDRPAR